MKVLTNSAVEPQVTIDTESDDFALGEDTAHYAWISHCEGETLDESALDMAQGVMEHFVMEGREEATAYTYGLIRGLLRKSRKPAGTPAHTEGAEA